MAGTMEQSQNVNRKIKLLCAIGRFSVGGGEKLLVHQLKAIDHGVFDVHAVTLFPETKETYAAQVALDATHWKKLDFASLFDVVAWWQLYSYLKKEKFDAVATSLFSANLIVRIAAVAAGIPVIIAYEHNIYPDKRPWQIWIDRVLSRKTNRIIVDAQSVIPFTAQQEDIPEEKFTLMYIPPLLENKAVLESPAALKKQLGLDRDSLVALTVSRLVPEKGHVTLIEAAKQVLQAFPKMYFVCVGWGPLEQSLKQKAQELGVAERVIFPGRMDIQAVLPLADMYIEPAHNVDIGIALMEAMKEKKPIIATNINEMPVFIKEGETGLLVEPRNPDMLAQKILTLVKDPSLRKKFGTAVGELMKEYTLETYMKHFENLIKVELKR